MKSPLPSAETWVIVTGASSGIGRATAKHLAQKGYKIVLASEQHEALRAVQSEILKQGQKAEVVDLDLLNSQEVDSFFERVQDKVGFCDILINNAGIGLNKTLDESTDAEFRRVFEVNFFALTNLCRQAFRIMKKEGRGQIINISSASARRSIAYMSCYGASKCAVHGFSQSLRLEAAPYGIKVTEILPISVQTEFFARAGYKPKGLVQTPESIAGLVERAILSSEAEICSSNLTRLGFLLDVLAPNFTAWILETKNKWLTKNSS